jgi:hypothetical protein
MPSPPRPLTDFLRAKATAQSGGDVDWPQRKREWIEALDALHRKIVELLREPLETKTVAVDSVPVRMSEEFLGEYDATELIIKVGDERVVLTPKGRNVVGARGRVDMRGEAGIATLVLNDAGNWGLVRQRVPTLVVESLDEGTLLEALRRVMRS